MTLCCDNISHEFLNKFPGKEYYVPYFLGILDLQMTAAMERLLTTFFFKSNSFTPKTYKLCTNAISDHYPLIVALDKVTIKHLNNRLTNIINYKKTIK